MLGLLEARQPSVLEPAGRPLRPTHQRHSARVIGGVEHVILRSTSVGIPDDLRNHIDVAEFAKPVSVRDRRCRLARRAMQRPCRFRLRLREHGRPSGRPWTQSALASGDRRAGRATPVDAPRHCCDEVANLCPHFSDELGPLSGVLAGAIRALACGSVMGDPVRSSLALRTMSLRYEASGGTACSAASTPACGLGFL